MAIMVICLFSEGVPYLFGSTVIIKVHQQCFYLSLESHSLRECAANATQELHN